MNQDQLKKAYQLLKRAYAELETQALNEGIDITSSQYDALQASVRERILFKMGYTVEQYKQAKETDLNSRSSTISDVMNDGTMSLLQKTQNRLDSVEKKQNEMVIPSASDIAKIATEVAKTFVKPPQITNQVVEKTIIKEPLIIRETQQVNVPFDERPFNERLSEISKRVETIELMDEPTMPDLEKFREDIRSDFDTNLAKNIDVLGMPNFRKLAMGLRQDIDSMVKSIVAGSNVTVTSSGGVYTISSTGGGGGVGSWTSFIVDGSTKTFSVTLQPTDVNADGIILFAQNGYTYNSGGSTITFANAPQQFAGYR